MIRKINRAVKDFLRPIRFAIGRLMWDKKIGAQNPKLENIIVNNKIKSVLFFRYDGKIGDMVINTMIFRELKKRYPNIKIGVVTRGAARDIISNSPWINEIYNYEKTPKKILELAERLKGEYDLLVDFSEFIRVNEMMFINRCGCEYNMGLDKGDWNLFNINLIPEKDFSYKEHVTKRYGAYLKKFGLDSFETDYDIFLNDEREDLAKKIYENLKKEKNSSHKGFVILNPYGASKHKNFNMQTLENIAMYLEELNYSVVLIYSPDKYDEVKEFYNKNKDNIPGLFMMEGIKSILDSACLIKYADYVITPDTSIIHIASAYNKPIIAVYPPNGGTYGVDHLVWGPTSEKQVVLFCKEAKNSTEKFDINTFSFDEMKKAIEEIF